MRSANQESGTNAGLSTSDSRLSAPHIVLVGLPGAGKTTIGQAAAQLIGRRFIDFDREIERIQGCRVADIFAERGEFFFRSLERGLTESLVHQEAAILAPGGGWVTNGDCLALLRPRGRIIYLKVRPETALGRLSGQVGTRPLLARGEPLAELRRLLAERESAYASADIVLEAERVSQQELIVLVAKLASSYGPGYVTP
jgi:shikimate kinase